MNNNKPLKDRYSISADELEHRMDLQEKYHDKPIHNVIELIDEAIGKVLNSLGVDITKSNEMIKQQQIFLGIHISEHPPEEMGKLSGFYIIAGDKPIAIVGDAWLGSDGLAYLDIYWIQKEQMERFGGVRIIQ